MNPVIEWCIKLWLYVISGVAGGTICYLMLKWKEISTQKKLTCFFIIALVCHVLEEWVCPAGLHYIHNLAIGTADANAYPMNRFSDMITNFVAVVFALIVLWKLPENPIAGFTLSLFGIGEAVAHTRLTVISLIKFHSAGLVFPYSPGLFTALFGFLVVSILLIIDLKKRRAFSVKMVFSSVASLIVVMIILVAIPENGLKNIDTPYRFPSAGFYERYIN